jgi:hypothetical protein
MLTVEAATTAGLWRAIRAQAEVWSQTPVVRHVADHLPRNAPREQRRAGSSTIPALLQGLSAAFSGMLHPLMLGTRVQFVMAQPFQPFERNVDESELKEWLRAAIALESAHRVTLAWFRSRLPGYPVVRAPQLARNSQFTTREYTPRFIWTVDERGIGLQFQSAPPELAGLPWRFTADNRTA